MEDKSTLAKQNDGSSWASGAINMAPLVFVIFLSIVVSVMVFDTIQHEHLSKSVTIDLILLLTIMFLGMALTCALIILRARQSIENSLKRLAERNDAELAEQRTKALQAAKMSALGEMVGGIAHEINTPLAAIKMFLSEAITELEQGPKADMEALANYVHKSDATIDRIAKIIKGLKTFARSGELDPFQNFSTQECIEDALILCGDRFKSESVDLRWEIPASTIMIECRPIEITQVLLNLMNNALDAVSKLPEKWVALHVDDTPEFVQIRVTDSGAGVPPEHLEKIFQPFFTTKEVGKGTGIGLSISVGIIKSHNGRLFIDPGGLNTSFVIEIPKRQSLEMDLEELKGSFT
jgi:C4-dicarboxylate-specific signal transduction histidine kinase